MRFAMLAALAAACRDAGAKPQQPAPRSLSYDEAVAALKQPKRWCEAAAAFAKLGDRRAIDPLYRVATLSEEGLPDRSCVRDALEQLGIHDEAARLVGSAQAADRRTGIRMMEAFRAPGQTPILTRLALNDPERELRALAAHALRFQNITPAWDTAMVSLLDASDSDTRALAATALAHRFDAAILAALRKRLGSETDASVRAALTDAIRVQDDHAAHP
ncbi:MAG TPA: HEAT repeat domain-containing protein [Kofleriaceae bacterium]